MVTFAIIEVDDGLTVTAIQAGQSPEDAATKNHGTLVDPGPYATYEDACDAMSALEFEEEEKRE